MVFDLFSSVDYSYSNMSSVKMVIWLFGFIWMLYLSKLYFYLSNRINNFLSFILGWYYKKIKSESLKKFKGSFVFLSGMFLIMLSSNLWGLVPYMFGLTTQLVWSSSLALMVFLSMVLSSIKKNFVSFMSHMTPQGSPLYLASVLNIMEFVSLFIRPLTLSLRLSMKMTTGHMLMSLLSTAVGVSFFSSVLWILLMFFIMGYLLFESGICMIQGLVFGLLSSNYLGEHS